MQLDCISASMSLSSWIVPLALLTLFTGAHAQTPVTDILFGHFELHADYNLSPGNVNAGWLLNVSYNLNNNFNDGTQIVRLDPTTTTLVASPRTTTKADGTPLLITSAVSRLGTVGSPLWLFPQGNILGTPFLGVRAVMNPGIFQAFFLGNYSASATGSIGLRLVSMTGTGPEAGGRFALWESDGSGLLFYLDTSNGITSADSIPTLPPNAHSHFNWGFSKPGSYNLTFEAVGKLNPQHGNVLTSTQKTFRFAIPFNSRIQTQSTLRLGYNNSLPRWHTLLEDTTNNVAYSPAQGFLEANTTANSTVIATFPTAVRQMPLSFAALGSTLSNIVGLDPTLAATGLADGVLQSNQITLRLQQVSGPGHFALLNAAGTGVLLNSADGISSADSIVVTRTSTLSTLAAFTQTGIYRITFTLEGLVAGTGQTRVSEPITLVFGSGITADHSYAVWRDSFERTHGLAANALSNAKADYDMDGVANGIEFLLFWHGFNPARADAHRILQAGLVSSTANFNFIRDTYKDALVEGSYQINSATSTDLSTWTVRSPRVDGQPLSTFENGSEEGNAYGRIMARQLRVLTDVGKARFFRFQATLP